MKDPARWRDLDGDAPDHIRALLQQAQGAPPPLPEAVRAASAAAVLKVAGASAVKTVAAVKLLAVAVVVAGASAVVVRSRGHRAQVAPPAHVARVNRATPAAIAPGPTTSPPPEVQPPMSTAHAPPHDEATPTHHPGSHAAESEPLERARAALARGDVALAVATLRDHARRFPQSALSEERDYLTFRASTRNETPEGVTREADRFLLRHPHGIYSAQVRAQRGDVP